ncbi:selenide, water dikinase SelD [Alphaproteobacteria bacterium KMM 3653]|uniref:Selenide, water dikinase SelD n=1 Tax=Harenicola maris TaxID=2841044 RepID=A0AAP2CQP5_9RHOB|nr:selenide, water dikinase SelD [Harenicola maris]
MKNTLPITQDIVLVGGGHSHALLLRSWGMNPVPGIRVTVINPGPTAPYTGMLPGYVAGHYTRDELEIDLVRLARFAGARLILGSATGIDRDNKRVQVRGLPDVAYDRLSIDVGITSEMNDLPGFAEAGHPAKPLGRFARSWDRFVATAKLDAPLACIGGGVAGIELAMAMSHRLRSEGHQPKVTVIEAETALAGSSGGARARLFEQLRLADITVIEGAKIARVTPTEVLLEDGRSVPSAFTVGAAGAKPHPWLADLGLEHEGGFLCVDRFLRSTSDPAIYAVGDCAHMVANPRPKAGVFAVRQAPALLRNLIADLTGGKPRPYRPQRSYLKLVSLGGKEALADKLGLAIQGPRVWQLKDRIDRAFMDKFADLPDMAARPLPARHALGMKEAMGDQTMCGGCGSKLGRDALREALHALPAPSRDDVMNLSGDDAAILAMDSDWQVVTTDHLRAFTNDPVTMTRIAAVHALGDIWAMGAEPQAALMQVILPRMAARQQAETLREIMTTAQDVMGAAGADIVGGHSSQGSDMTIGFSITGLRGDYPIGLDGAEPGQALILTKPIGSGTLLAGEMQGKAEGNWLSLAFAQMAQPQGKAAAILAAAGTRAMTDVTGFGLAGHLIGICEASNVAAELSLADIPLMTGAADLAQAGVRSTIWADNRAAASAIDPSDLIAAPLLFDPQTAGGLLAAVPEGNAKGAVKTLTKAGYRAAVIGRIDAGAPYIKLRS